MMLFEATWNGFRIMCTVSFSTNADNQRFVVFCSHGHNFEIPCGDSMPVEWSTCQLSENATCGQGVRTRLLSCVRSDGKPVSVDRCEQVICLYLYLTPKALFFLIFVFDLNNAWYKWQTLISSHCSLGSIRVIGTTIVHLTNLNLVKINGKHHFMLGKWIH